MQFLCEFYPQALTWKRYGGEAACQLRTKRIQVTLQSLIGRSLLISFGLQAVHSCV